MNISKILMYEFWYNYIIPKYGDSKIMLYRYWQLYYLIKTKDFFEDIPNDVEKRFDTSNYNKKDKIPLPIGKNKKVPGLFKDELGGKIIEFVALRPKTYSYLDDNCNKHKKAKGTKKCVIKQKSMFQNVKDCLFNSKNVYRSQERFNIGKSLKDKSKNEY